MTAKAAPLPPTPTGKRVGVLGMISLFIVGMLGGAGVIMVQPNELSHTYVCSNSGEIGVFYGGITTTGYTAYPYSENKTKAKSCSMTGIKGTWETCTQYGKEHGVTCAEALSEKANTDDAPVVIHTALTSTDGTPTRFLKCVEE